MNEATAWRLEIARQVAARYAACLPATAIAVTGSVGRLAADAHSDLELLLFYATEPADPQRSAAALQAGGRDLEVFPFEEDEWAETFYVDGLQVSTSGFLERTAEAWLEDVLIRNDTSEPKHIQLSAIQHAIPITGAPVLDRWRARLSHYPDALARTMIEYYADIRWDACEMLAARDDRLAQYALFCEVERDLLGMLLGLNRQFLDNPRFKWMDRTIEGLQLKPPDLSPRLKAVFQIAPLEGVEQLQALLEETYSLIERHGPGIEVEPFRSRSRRRRCILTPGERPAAPREREP